MTSAESDETSNNGLARRLAELDISSTEDPTFLSPETRSVVSLSDDAPTAEPLEKLNDFLLSCGIQPIPKPWIEWENASATTRWRYTSRAVEVVATVLTTLSPNDAGALWQNIVSSSAMQNALQLEETPLSTRDYLQALAETFNNAEGWKTRRQILSVMTGIASYKTIASFIPTLSRYRYTMANVHRLQFGCGAPIQHQQTTRIRVSRSQLDHFLAFITSPHLVQDLPFGQKILTLSNGKQIEVPNVIRTMVPQRIARQYVQYCEDTSFTPFSERTMLRVLSECKASVRKSLQGLDYFAGDGARAFDDLTDVVRQISQLSQLGKEWERHYIDGLKTAKLYLKSDYKVILVYPS